MKLATIAAPDGDAVAMALDDGRLQRLAAADLAALLSSPRGAAWEQVGEPLDATQVRFRPLVPRPGKIFCVGLNYRSHIAEMGRPMPDAPTLFAKFASSLLGAYDDIEASPNSTQIDWEAELAFVIGRPLRRASATEAKAAIAGYTVANDISMRDWQWRTTQWLQGKTFDRSTPVGPYLTTADETDASDLQLTCEVDGQIMQQARTSDLLFTPDEIAAYISQFATLEPGDLILSGTPGGVGAGRDPKMFLQVGQQVTTTIEGLGSCVNKVCLPDRAGDSPASN